LGEKAKVFFKGLSVFVAKSHVRQVEAYYENESSPIARGIAAGIFHLAFWRPAATQNKKEFLCFGTLSGRRAGVISA
jgi:hypothetical protein